MTMMTASAPSFRIYRATSTDGVSVDTHAKFVFEPAVESDELFDALRCTYPEIKTHSERKRQAVLDFLVQEREMDLRALERMVSGESQSQSPAVQSWSNGSVSNFDQTPYTASMSFESTPSPVSEQADPMPIVPSFKAREATSDSASNSNPSFHVWNPSSSKPVKLHKRRCMTDQEKEEYRQRRIVGSCDSCKQKRRKCRHFEAEANASKSSKRTRQPAAVSTARRKVSKAATRSNSSEVSPSEASTSLNTSPSFPELFNDSDLFFGMDSSSEPLFGADFDLFAPAEQDTDFMNNMLNMPFMQDNTLNFTPYDNNFTDFSTSHYAQTLPAPSSLPHVPSMQLTSSSHSPLFDWSESPISDLVGSGEQQQGIAIQGNGHDSGVETSRNGTQQLPVRDRESGESRNEVVLSMARRRKTLAKGHGTDLPAADATHDAANTTSELRTSAPDRRTVLLSRSDQQIFATAQSPRRTSTDDPDDRGADRGADRARLQASRTARPSLTQDGIADRKTLGSSAKANKSSRSDAQIIGASGSLSLPTPTTRRRRSGENAVTGIPFSTDKDVCRHISHQTSSDTTEQLQGSARATLKTRLAETRRETSPRTTEQLQGSARATVDSHPTVTRTDKTTLRTEETFSGFTTSSRTPFPQATAIQTRASSSDAPQSRIQTSMPVRSSSANDKPQPSPHQAATNPLTSSAVSMMACMHLALSLYSQYFGQMARMMAATFSVAQAMRKGGPSDVASDKSRSSGSFLNCGPMLRVAVGAC